MVLCIVARRYVQKMEIPAQPLHLPMTIDVPAFIAARNIGRFQILVAFLCAMVVLLDGLNTQVIGYLGPALAKDWHLSRAALGPVFSASLAGLMIGLLVIGPFSDRM